MGDVPMLLLKGTACVSPQKQDKTAHSSLLIMILSGTLWGSWARRHFWVPHFLMAGNRFPSPPKTFPEFRLGKFKELLFRQETGGRDKGGGAGEQ